ncbi:MAG: prolyl oligopeptidase family serine peptidase [Chloroflexota bacterium]
MIQPPDETPGAAWKRRFYADAPYAAVAQSNPAHGMVMTNSSGIYQLYAWDLNARTLRQLTSVPGGVTFGGISPDGRSIYYHDEAAAMLVRVPFAGRAAPEPVAADMPPFVPLSLSESLDGRLLGFSAQGEDGTCTAFIVPVAADNSLGERRILYHSGDLVIGPLLNHDATYAVVATTDRTITGDYALLAFGLRDVGDEQRVRVLQEEAGSVQAVAFAPWPGDSRLLGTTDVTGEARPLVWDVASGDRVDLPLDDLRGDMRAVAWLPGDPDPDGGRLLLEHVYAAMETYYVYDLKRSTLDRLATPPGTYAGVDMLPAAAPRFPGAMIAQHQDGATPPRVVAFDTQTGAPLGELIPPEPPDLPPGQPWRSVTFTTLGGATIQGWLMTPPGDGPFPLVIHAHPGPTDVQTEVYAPEALAWVDHGAAWLSVNYRGSTTFGFDHMAAIGGILGHREVDDLAAAVAWAVAQGIARPEAVIVGGVGYGGFLALQAAGKRPDLWAAVIAEDAIADWRLLYDDLPEPLRAYHRALWGGDPVAKPDVHRTGSPISHVEAVAAPLLVIQPGADPRLPTRQMHAYAAAAQDAGQSLVLHWYSASDDRRAQAVEHMRLKLRWAADVLRDAVGGEG